MKQLFSRLSLRTKLIVLLVSTAGITLLVACSILWTYQYVHYRNMLLSQGGASAQLISDDVGPALLFHDAAVAKEALMALRDDRNVRVACVYSDGEMLARYASQATASQPCPSMEGPDVVFTHRELVLRRSIAVKDAHAGELVLVLGLQEMYDSLRRFAATIFLAAFGAIGLGTVLAAMLQRVISGPILDLTRVAVQVSSKGDYTVRAHRTSSDEIGVLIDQFNTMMDGIQERKEDLRKAHDNLEDKVRERTRALESEIAERKVIERDLDAARVAAENASRAKSAFLANMSHELRTPLNAVIGYSEMLYEDAVAASNASMASDLEKILDSARHLLTLISDVLDLSKIEAGKLQLMPSLAPAREILREVLATAEVLARRHQNELRVDEALGDIFVEVDPLRIRQCLLNLISNACKFTERGVITLQAEEKRVNGSPFVVWTVRDTGIGIPAEQMERLFKTFSQVDDSNTRRFGGSGLGLAISQQLCHAMGGYITVESVPGQGSSFALHMPVATSAEFAAL